MAKKLDIACCGMSEAAKPHPDHMKELHRINRISGQLDGVKRMISEREYCPKILTQIHATRAALKSLESVILEKHLAMCVKDALASKDEKEVDRKIEEIMDVFRRC